MKTYTHLPIPHPFPYQGSKRNIAKYILPFFPSDVERLIEPFCGAGAISIAASAYGLSKGVILNDLNVPLMDLWKEILENPEELTDKYEELWLAQQSDRKTFFFKIRDEFNQSHRPHHLLYLLARIVKGSVRYNSEGDFNQSADNRRAGMRPSTMRKNILGVSQLLAQKAEVKAKDYREIVEKANTKDLIYMDPPYQGTSFTRDHRYYDGVSFDDLVSVLSRLNDKETSYIISYDGLTGPKTHGKLLPKSLELKHLDIYAGRSSQATLLGNSEETIESLYLSPALTKRLGTGKQASTRHKAETQLELAFT